MTLYSFRYAFKNEREEWIELKDSSDLLPNVHECYSRSTSGKFIPDMKVRVSLLWLTKVIKIFHVKIFVTTPVVVPFTLQRQTEKGLALHLEFS